MRESEDEVSFSVLFISLFNENVRRGVIGGEDEEESERSLRSGDFENEFS
jgi:hypothetical protein